MHDEAITEQRLRAALEFLAGEIISRGDQCAYLYPIFKRLEHALEQFETESRLLRESSKNRKTVL